MIQENVYSMVKKWGFVWLLAGLAFFRLTIWKLMRGMPIFFKEDLGNIGVALAIMLVAVGWLAYKCYVKQGVRITGLGIPLTLLLVSSAISLTYTVDAPSTLSGLLVLASHVALFVMIVDALDTREKQLGFLYILLACACVTALFGVKEFFYLWTRSPIPEGSRLEQVNHNLHYILSSRRITSFLGWPNSLAGYLGLVLPFGLLLPFRIAHRGLRWLSFFVAFMIVAAFLFTFSFLGWTSFFLASVVIFVCGRGRWGVAQWSTSQKAWLYGAMALFVGLFLWVIFRKDFIGSFIPRLAYYQSAFSLIKESPWLGYGWGTFGIVGRRFAESREGLTTYVHNSYIQVWVEIGLIGLLSVVWLAVDFFRRLFDALRSSESFQSKWLILVVGWGLAAFFIDNLFSFTLLKSNIAVHGWIMLGVFYALVKKNASRFSMPQSVVKITGLALSLVAVFFLTRMVSGFLVYHQGVKVQREGNLVQAEKFYKKAGELNPYQSQFPAAAGEVAYKRFYIERNPRALTEAKDLYLEALRRSPEMYLYNFVLSRIYLNLRNTSQAAFYARRAKEISPYQYQRDLKRLRERAQRVSQAKKESTR